MMSILVVAIHTNLFGCTEGPVVRIAIPVFFIVSGYLFFDKIKELREDEKWSALIHTIKRNGQLYLFWFILLLPFTLYTRRYFVNGVLKGILEFIRGLFFHSTFRASWYIMALIIGIIIVFLLSRCFANWIILLISIIFYVLTLLSSNYYFLIEMNSNTREVFDVMRKIVCEPHGNFMVSLIFLTIGKMIVESKQKRIPVYGYAVSGMLALLGLLAEHLWLNEIRIGEYDNTCYVMLIPVAIFTVLFALNLQVKFKKAVYLRKTSTIGYCVHIPVSMMVTKVFQILNIHDSNNLLWFVVTILITYAIAGCILKLAEIPMLKFLRYAY